MLRIISPILSIILAVAIFFFFAKPIFADIEEIQEETNEYREAVEKATEFNDFLQTLITTRNSFSSYELERLETLIPDDIDEVRALVDLKALAEQNGMLFGNIDVQGTREQQKATSFVPDEASNEVTSADFKTADISFSVIGSYEQMLAFLQNIERSLILMDVVELNFKGTESSLSLYNFTVRLYALNADDE